MTWIYTFYNVGTGLQSFHAEIHLGVRDSTILVRVVALHRHKCTHADYFKLLRVYMRTFVVMGVPASAPCYVGQLPICGVCQS